MIIGIIICIVFMSMVWMGIVVFTHSKKFGALATGEDFYRLESATNWKKNCFHNIHDIEAITTGNPFAILYAMLFKKSPCAVPSKTLPGVKVDLHTLDPHTNTIVWFGHSSYLMQLDGKNILVDPVFSGSASPVKSFVKAFKGSDVYTALDMPYIDYLFITHDHWDHLDYETVMALKDTVGCIVTGLGVGAHFKRWGFDMTKVIETAWGDTTVRNDWVIHTTPAQHFSGRGLERNKSLWSSFVLKTQTQNIYIGGDSGYSTHFADIGKAYGPFDLAVLECGQYNEYWKSIHMMPEETIQAGIDLRAQKILPVHWGKFRLALHSWDEPITRALLSARTQNIPLMYPLIGEVIPLNGEKLYTEWWK